MFLWEAMRTYHTNQLSSLFSWKQGCSEHQGVQALEDLKKENGMIKGKKAGAVFLAHRREAPAQTILRDLPSPPTIY